MDPYRAVAQVSLALAALGTARADTGDPAHGRVLFQQSCAICHPTIVGPDNRAMSGQGPGLAGVVGRRAASLSGFTYTKALHASGLKWDPTSLDRFLASPSVAVPGTNMPIMVTAEADRRDIIAYLVTLKAAAGGRVASAQAALKAPAEDPGDWRNDSPGTAHAVSIAALPPPYATFSAGNNPQVVTRPADAGLSVPAGFLIKPFAAGLDGPRILRVAPNGDLFIAETRAGHIRVMRTSDGADAPDDSEVFASGLDRPFGIAFYPAGPDPRWVYVANNNSVVRFPYRSGDMKARGGAEVIVPVLCWSTGGHSTRDIAFSNDGRRLFISVGSGSNIAEAMEKKEPGDIPAWEAQHGLGAAWGSEANRADILVTDPEGHAPLHPFATGIRNGVGIAVDASGVLWSSTNERDGLGDDLVPDYITRVREGAYYGWPWYYMGNRVEPRHAGERPDLAGKMTDPDVPLQAHSASLEMVFYTATSGASVFPAEYRGDIFAAEHGSWNRSNRTGSKIIRVRLKDGVPTGEYDDFVTGWVIDRGHVWGRPVGVAVLHDGSLLISEDGNNTLWRVSTAGH